MKTNIRVLIRYITLPVLFLVLFLHITALAGTTEKKLVGQTLLRVGYIPELSQLPLVLSYDRERLSYQKIRVQLRGFKSYIALEAAFKTKAIDVAYLPIPTILKMRAEGVGVLMGDTLHRNGSSLVVITSSLNKKGHRSVFGIPSISSSEHLMLDKYLSNKGLIYGADFKVVTVRLDRAVEELKLDNIDGLILPEPYPTMAALRLFKNVQYLDLQSGDMNAFQSALAVNRDFLKNDPLQGILEWIDSVQRACLILEKDLRAFDGEQTIIIQQQYFGFDKVIMHEAFSHSHSSLAFAFEKVPRIFLDETLKYLISKKIIFNSVPLDDVYLDSMLLSESRKERENEN